MSDVAARYRTVAAAFTDRVTTVPAGAWDNPAPCAGWVARDVVRHLVEWVPGFFAPHGLDLDVTADVDADPATAWVELNTAVQAALDDPDTATREIDSPMGRISIESAIATIVLGDVLVHTWDLARATGLDETLDPEEVHRMFAGMEAMDEPMRASGHFGPKVELADAASEQDRLIAFTGRDPRKP